MALIVFSIFCHWSLFCTAALAVLPWCHRTICIILVVAVYGLRNHITSFQPVLCAYGGDIYIIMTGGVVGISLLSIFINGIVVSLWNFSSTALFEFC